MAQQTLNTVLQTVNEVRRLLGFKTVNKLDADRNSLMMMRLLNVVVAEISDYGDWQEMYNEVDVTVAVTSTFSLGINHPVQRIHEISLSGQRQALYPTTIEHINQLQRGNTTGGVARFFAVKGVDNSNNPLFTIHPTPVTADVGNIFTVCYYKKEGLYDITTADSQIPFPANVVIQGLYAKALAEESGGALTKEGAAAYQDYRMLMDEGLKRFNSDTGTDIRIQPKSNYSRG